MPPPELPVESDDLNALAARAVDRRQPDDARKSEFADLGDSIRRLAVSLSIRLTGQARDDLIEPAPGEVFARLAGFSPSGSFAAWCHRTLHNWMVDELRKAARRREHEREAARRRPEIRSEEPPEEPLTPQELEALCDRPPGQRLALMCLTGLWRDIPPAVWRGWCDAYTSSGDRVLPTPFPTVEFEACPDARERAAILAELLRVRRGTLAVWVHRCAARLRSLRGE